MRIQILMGRKHGAKDFVPMCKTSDPIAEQREMLKDIKRAGRVNKEFAEVATFELVTVDRFDTPESAKKKADAIKAQEAAFKKHQDELAKKQQQKG